VGYDWVCPFVEVNPDAAASAEATPDQGPAAPSPSARAPSTGEDPIVVPKMRVRRTQGSTRREWTPPGPSRLRETVQAQGDEKLNKVYKDFERFRITGKQPPVSVPIGGPQITQYSPLASSAYRPFSAPFNVTDPTRRDGWQDPGGLTQNSGTSRRLGSTDLFPDRYRQESRPVVTSTGARDSIVEDPKPATTDSAPEARDSIAENPKTATPDPAPSKDASKDASIPPYTQSVIDSRRERIAAAKSDRSDRSSTSSTESSRARNSLAYSLDKDKAAWSPNASKSTASISFAGFKNAVRSIANTFMPSGDKSEAEQVTRELSRSPRRSGDRAGRVDDSDTEEVGENARPASSSRRRSRKEVAAGSSGGRAGGYDGASDTEQTVENARPVSSSRRRSRKSHDGASDTEQTAENARPVSSSGRRSRKNTVSRPSGGRASRDDEIASLRDVDLQDTAAWALYAESLDENTLHGMLGVLPSPPSSPPKRSSPVVEEATNDHDVVSGKKQGPTTSEFLVLVS
jgi:hypothetical protein